MKFTSRLFWGPVYLNMWEITFHARLVEKCMNISDYRNMRWCDWLIGPEIFKKIKLRQNGVGTGFSSYTIFHSIWERTFHKGVVDNFIVIADFWNLRRWKLHWSELKFSSISLDTLKNRHYNADQRPLAFQKQHTWSIRVVSSIIPQTIRNQTLCISNLNNDA